MMRGRLFVALVPLLAGSCTSIEVKKLTDDSANVPGIRYSLPKPFIQVTPNADGSVAVEVVYLPDADNTYAIDAAAYASSLTLDIQLEKGFLKKVEMKPDATTVTEQAIKTAGEVGSKVLDAEKASQEAQRKKIEAADAKVKAAEEAVVKAKLEVELAQIDKASADRGKDETAKEKARVELEKAQARLRVAERALDELKASRGALAAARADGETTAKPTTKGFEIRGPVLYAVQERIAEGKPVVTLQAVKINGDPQKKYRTVITAGSTARGATLKIAPIAKQSKQFYQIEHSRLKLRPEDIKELKFFLDEKKEKPLPPDAADKIRKAAVVENDVIWIPSDDVDKAKIVVIEVNSASGLIPKRS
jgi:hypothetical protein